MPENNRGALLRPRNDFRRRDSVGHGRQREHKSGHRAREPHVEKRFASGDRRTYSNHRAESSKQRWRGNEIRIADIDAVNFARHVVPHFVREQNRQQRERKRNSHRQQSRMLERQQHQRQRILAARERLAIFRVRSPEFHPYGQSGYQRQQKKDQCRPKGAPLEGLRRKLRALRILCVEDFYRKSVVPVPIAFTHSRTLDGALRKLRMELDDAKVPPKKSQGTASASRK